VVGNISMINNGRPLYVRILGFDSDGNLECEHSYEPNIDRIKKPTLLLGS